MPDTRDPRPIILWTIAMAALAVVAMWALYLVRGVLLLMYVSALFAIGFSPLVRLIQKQKLLPIGTRRFPRWLAILTIYLVIIGALASVALMIVPPLVAQARELWNALPQLFERAQTWLIARGVLDHPVTLKEAMERAPASGTDAVGTVVNAVWGLVGGVFGLVTILILTFYFLVEAGSLFDSFLRVWPPGRREHVRTASREITIKVSAWLTGQLLLAAVIGATSAIGLGVMGVPYFYVLALISAIGEMIPVVGPVLAAIPAVAVAATVSVKLVVLVLIFFVLQQQVENHLLVPKLMERQVGVSAVVVIVALLIGGTLAGIAGAILAVPTAAILQVLLQQITASRDRTA